MQFIEPSAELVGDDDTRAIRRVTDFDGDFLDTLRSERLAKAAVRAGDLDRVASVPAQVVDIWLRQGFDIYRASAREIVRKLERENLGVFVTTPKAV